MHEEGDGGRAQCKSSHCASVENWKNKNTQVCFLFATPVEQTVTLYAPACRKRASRLCTNEVFLKPAPWHWKEQLWRVDKDDVVLRALTGMRTPSYAAAPAVPAVPAVPAAPAAPAAP